MPIELNLLFVRQPLKLIVSFVNTSFVNSPISIRDKVREVSGVLDAYIKHKHYQHATKLLKTNGKPL